MSNKLKGALKTLEDILKENQKCCAMGDCDILARNINHGLTLCKQIREAVQGYPLEHLNDYNTTDEQVDRHNEEGIVFLAQLLADICEEVQSDK